VALQLSQSLQVANYADYFLPNHRCDAVYC
jgi:hypothetical protein